MTTAADDSTGCAATLNTATKEAGHVERRGHPETFLRRRSEERSRHRSRYLNDDLLSAGVFETYRSADEYIEALTGLLGDDAPRRQEDSCRRERRCHLLRAGDEGPSQKRRSWWRSGTS